MTDCYVYVIASVFNGKPSMPVKIGISTDVEKRMRSIKTSCPNQICLLHQFSFPDREFARAIEQLTHVVNEQHRGSGEWFTLSPRQALIEVCSVILSVAFADDVIAARVEDWMRITRVDGALDLIYGDKGAVELSMVPA